jgi:hypothetical protein
VQGVHRRARRFPAAAGLACAAALATCALPGAAREGGLERWVAEIEALVADAHFHTALVLAQTAREEADRRAEDRASADALAPARARARLELLAATSEIAIGRRAAAARSMRRALRADPELRLDEAEASPKLVELWRRARRVVAAEAPGRE